MVRRVKLGDASVIAVAYGCMGLSQAYEPCDEAQGIRTLNAVLIWAGYWIPRAMGW